MSDAAALRVTELSLDDSRWSRLSNDHPNATAFHTPAWARVLAETYGMRAFALGISSGARLVGLLPTIEVGGRLRARRWVSLPFTDVAPPLLAPELDEREVGPLLDSARRAARVSAIDVHAPLAGVPAEHDGVEHVLALGADAAAVAKRFSSQHRRNVKLAERNGIRVRRGTTAEDLTRTYYALHVATRRRQGVPSQPRAFFRRLWELILEPGGGFVLFAEHAGSTAAGAVFLGGSSTLIYKYGASESSLWHLRPNNPIFADAITWGCEHGCSRLHFGRTDEGNAGLRSFKSGWGADERPLAYARIGDRAVRGRARSSGGALAFAIRNSPAIVGRAVGTALYRYAA